MQLYLIVLITFLLINFSLSIFLNKYNFSKFFIFVISYFTLINIINLVYFKNIEFFTFQTLFFVCLLFLFVGLYSSVSVKIMIYLYSIEYRIYSNFKEIQYGIYYHPSISYLFSRLQSIVYPPRLTPHHPFH